MGYLPGVFAFALIFAFCDAYGIGANDVANSFASSVSSKSLTYKQAVFIAFFTEFLGAVALGSGVAETIRSKIVSVNLFENTPGELMLAMTCALVGSSGWTILATRLGLPVSTTHSIVGAVMGSAIAAHGFDAVQWDYQSGFLRIVVSWITSPLLSGMLGAILYFLTKVLVLANRNSLQRAYWTIPLYMGGTWALVSFYMAYKGAPALKLDQLDPNVVGGIVAAIAIAGVLIGHFLFVPFARKYYVERENLLRGGDKTYATSTEAQGGSEGNEEGGGSDGGEMSEERESSDRSASVDLDVRARAPSKLESEEREVSVVTEVVAAASTSPPPNRSGVIGSVMGFFDERLSKDVVNHTEQDIVDMHEEAVKYDQKTERLYSFLQVTTAAFASFAHGSNDVANAVGPLTTVFSIYNSGVVSTSSTSVPIWILVFGGLSINLGLMTYGFHIMRSLGNKITYQSPSRGFTSEFAATLTVLSATKLNLPVSTTHCITGATTGVGLAGGSMKAVNWKHLAGIFGGWLITVPATALVSGIVFSLFAYSPKHGE